MLENQSAIASAYVVGRIGAVKGVIGVTVRERLHRRLIQVSSSPENFNIVCEQLTAALNCDVPGDLRRATSSADQSVIRVGPERLWITGPFDEEKLLRFDCTSLGDEAIVTEIEHSRMILRISGAAAGTLLSRGLPIDLDPEIFPVNSVAQSAIHHMPVLVHRVDISDDRVFDVYVTRDLAMTFWEWLTEAAAPLGCEILQPD